MCNVDILIVLATAAGGTKLLAVDETGPPQTLRHLFQCFDVGVTQFDAPRSNFVARGRRVGGRRFHSPNAWFVLCHAEFNSLLCGNLGAEIGQYRMAGILRWPA